MNKNEQGAADNRYRVIPRTLIFITENESVLLIKGASTKRLWAGKYNGIGGHIEKGEDIYESAVRELFEETGLRNIPLTLRGSIMVDVEEGLGISLFIFSGVYQSGKIVDGAEGKLEWIKIRELSQHPLVEDLYTLIPRLFLNNDRFIFGKYYFLEDQLQIKFQD